MYAPLFETVAADADVQTNFGVSPTRVYPFGEAPQNVASPYAVWQQVAGGPENCLSDVPDIDRFTLQIDVYADTATAARDAAKALRDAIEPEAHIVAWRGELKEPGTRDYRVSFDVDWMVSRETVS